MTTGMTTMVGDSSSGGDTGEPGNCEDEQVIPDPPVDCSGADGTLDGSAIIEVDGDDPSVLEGISVVTGSIQVNRTDLADLNFMACVTEVGGEVTIFDNDSLTNVDGLHSLTSIGTDFIFSENGALVDFNGLPNIAQMNNNIIMKNNDAMETITGFHSFVGIINTVPDMNGVDVQIGNITIQNNPALQSIDGLGGLRVVGGVFAVTGNEALCISSVDCVGNGITMPASPPDTWSTQGNNLGC